MESKEIKRCWDIKVTVITFRIIITVLLLLLLLTSTYLIKISELKTTENEGEAILEKTMN